MKLAIFALAIPALALAQVAKFRVHETAGLRRFSYPVRARIPSHGGSLKLLENGKAIPAQFTAIDGSTEIDFNVSIGPWETRDFRVEPGESDGGAGVSVEQSSGVFAIHHNNGLEFDVPEDLAGLLNQAKTSKLEYLRAGSRGLLIGGATVKGKGSITKRGPLVAAVRFESPENTVDLDFPRSKAWVEVRWKAKQRASDMAADLNLAIEGQPTLVDFGANSTVYDALKPGQHLAFSATAAEWFVHLNDELYASGKKAVEGWAHVMDKDHATAIAIAGFGRASKDHIAVSADGHVQIRREFTGGGERNLHFWLHFVTMPVQVGAATSPQSMQNPLRIELY